MASNTYTVNGGAPQLIEAGVVDIDMSTETGVKAGCKDYPIPLLNKITVTSAEGALSKSRTIYAGYRVVQQMLGELVPAGSYDLNNPRLNTIIHSGKFGIFEPGHYSSATSAWSVYSLDANKINSIINVGSGIKICLKIAYTKVDTVREIVYVDIPGASGGFTKLDNTPVPYYQQIGGSYLSPSETVESAKVQSADRRAWFESVLTADNLDINLSSSITTPDTTQDMIITLMAYIGSTPTANNTFRIQPMTVGSTTSVTVPFETYNPTITISNADVTNNPDAYNDGYGSVAEYSTLTDNDTTITVEIIAP